MKLAEALQERADLLRRINALKSLLSQNALVQEGERPSEDPEALLRELDACTAQYETIICRINLTNCQTTVGDRSMTALLAARDALKLRISAYQTLGYEAGQNTSRAARTEIKILPAIDPAALRKKTDLLAKELRMLDNRIQEANWNTELL